MKLLPYIFGLLLFTPSCVPSFQTGPDPHSIEFDRNKLNEILNYIVSNNITSDFVVSDPPATISIDLIDRMNDFGILSFEHIAGHKIFFCGYGVVGKGWGFVYGDFPEKETERSATLRENNKYIHFGYLEKIEGNWYRFGSS